MVGVWTVLGRRDLRVEYVGRAEEHIGIGCHFCCSYCYCCSLLLLLLMQFRRTQLVGSGTWWALWVNRVVLLGMADVALIVDHFVECLEGWEG